jgi:hypothetical protein
MNVMALLGTALGVTLSIHFLFSVALIFSVDFLLRPRYDVFTTALNGTVESDSRDYP